MVINVVSSMDHITPILKNQKVEGTPKAKQLKIELTMKIF
jgi:hypothetical protein